jgi:hypothetical protein
MSRFVQSGIWAREVFGEADLGDARRSERLIRMAGSLANAAGASPAKASATSADLEGAYRFLRNEAVEPEAIVEAGCSATINAARSIDTLLAVEDTTTLSYRHGAAQELGDLGGRAKSKRRGYFVHSSLALDAETGATVGLLDQQYWMRETSKRGQRHDRKRRPYEEKESFKWQKTAERLRAMAGDEMMARFISVCDREADVYQYLDYKIRRSERFVVRAARDRALQVQADNPEKRRLFSAMAEAPTFGAVTVEVPQRGGRPARTADLTLRAAPLTLHRTVKLPDSPKSLVVNVILASEEAPPKGAEPLTWVLLTTESIELQPDVLRVLDHYRRRWRIEEFHKAWKSGAGVEERRLQSAGNIHRLAAILAFVAVRLLQLRELAANSADTPCTTVLPVLHWKLLWISVEKKKKRPPEVVPTVKWAFEALGRLGGWKDTKRTGRIGWEAVWDGWFRLQERLDGYQLAREINL